ncbi:hypothetical protein PENSPDRAFT_756980 [Peniophora sp. CONT]|nr:hypothetical protein PENSPDRAFT_756980 [Peniophora sp. CONT]
MSAEHRSEWNAGQRAYERALVDGPTAALERFRTAFQNRAPGPLSKGDEVVELAEVLNVRMYEAFGDTLELRRAITENKIVPFLVDIMAEPHFLQHYLGFSSSICGLLMGNLDLWLSAARDQRFGNGDRAQLNALGFSDVYWKKLDKAWESLWEQRMHLINSNDLRFKLALLEQLELIAFSTRDLEMTLSINPKGSKRLVQVAFFVWAQLHGNERMSEKDVLQLRSYHHAPAILWDYYSVSALSSSTIQLSVKQIFEDVGIDRSIRAAENAMKWSFLLTGAQLVACIKMLTLLHNTFLSSPLLSNMLRPMAMAFDSQEMRLKFAESQGLGSTADKALSQRMEAVSAGCEHIKIVFLALHAGLAQPSMFPAASIQAVWSIFLHAVDLAFKTEELRLGHRNARPVSSEASLSKLTAAFAQATDSLAVALNEGGLPTAVIDGLRTDATAHTEGTSTWYSIVPDVRRSIKAQSPLSSRFTAFLDAWTTLGKALGIDEVEERNRRASYQARICSWRTCSFHFTPSPKPLFTCKGCHETRYCSKDCQTRDWKQGGHREECRRLKK